MPFRLPGIGRKSPEDQPYKTTSQGHNPEQRFSRWRVKISHGASFFRWCSETASSLRPEMSLLKRAVRNNAIVVKTIIKPPQKGKYWKKVPLTDNLQERRGIAIDSALSQLPYWMNWEDVSEAECLHGGRDITTRPGEAETLPLHEMHVGFFEEISPLVAEAGAHALTQLQQTHPLLRNMKLSPEGILFDSKTGLTATLVKNNRNNTLTLSFGGTNSGLNIRLFEKQSHRLIKKRFNLTWLHIKADIRNLVGWNVPVIYKQAAKLTEVIAEMAKKQDMPVTLTGHSLGGGMAAYAAAKFGLKARTFSPAALGKKTLADLTDDQKASANKLIHNYMVINDPVNNHWLSNPFRMITAPTIIGKRSFIKKQPATGRTTLLGRHAWSHRHYMEVLKREK